MAMAEEKAIRNAEDIQVLAGMFNLAGMLVHDEPQRETLDEWAEEQLFESVPLGIDDEDVREGFRLMNGWMRTYAEGDRDVLCGQVQREWLRLFVGAGEPQVPSWANYYFDFDQRVMGRETLKVRESYRAFGVQLDDLNKEPDDNLGLMLKFIGFLLASEAEAVAAADEDETDRVRIAQTVFLKDHILPWIARWSYEGEKHAETAFYQGAVKYVFGLVRWRAAQLGFSYADGAFAIHGHGRA